jgi:hypothetical protein
VPSLLLGKENFPEMELELVTGKNIHNPGPLLLFPLNGDISMLFLNFLSEFRLREKHFLQITVGSTGTKV